MRHIEEIYMDAGEKIHLRCEVKTVCGDDISFRIIRAGWELRDQFGNIESSGDCSIDNHILDAFICPKKTGVYKLRYIYDVADETWVDVVKLVVR